MSGESPHKISEAMASRLLLQMAEQNKEEVHPKEPHHLISVAAIASSLCLSTTF